MYGTAAYAYKLRNGPSIQKTFNVHLTNTFKDDLLNKAIGCDCDDFYCPITLVSEFSDFCTKDTDVKISIVNEGKILAIELP